MNQFPLTAEVDALVSSEDTMLAHAVSKCVADLRSRALFNKTYEKLATAIANNASRNAALKASGLATEPQSEAK